MKERFPRLDERYPDLRRATPFEVVSLVLVFLVCLSVAHIALSTHDVYMAGPRNPSTVAHMTGSAADAHGVLLATIGFLALGYLARLRIYTKPFWLLLAVSWAGFLLAEFVMYG